MGRHSPNQYHGSAGNPGDVRSNRHGNLFKFKQTGMTKGMARGHWVQIQDKKTSYDKKNADELNKLRGELNALKNKKAAPAAKPKPKPKGDQQIDPVKDSPEISAARKVVNDFQAGQKDNKSPWAQAQADAADSATFGNFNPGGKTSSDEPQKDPQAFADKYKLDLIGSGATKKASEPGDTPMTGKQILAQDKQQGWS